jgi:hypothetical protein
MVFFGEIHVFPQLRWIVLFGANRPYIHFETPQLEKVFPSQTKWISTGKPCARCNSFQYKWISFVIYMCFSTTLNRQMWNKMSLSPHWKYSRKYSFQKQTQFLQGNKVLDASASNTDGFLSRNRCLLLTQLNRSIWRKMSLSPSWKFWLAGRIPFKN